MAQLAIVQTAPFDNNPDQSLLSSHEVTPVEDMREQILASIRGTTIYIPDYRQILGHWPAGVHQDSEKLKASAQKWLESTFGSLEDDDVKRLQWLKACDISSFAACWWPYARFEALLVLTYMSYWLFAWDDETDSSEFSSLSDSFERASAFRAETVRYMEAVLDPPADGVDVESVSSQKLITTFRTIGEGVKKGGNGRQMQGFLRELRFFVEMTGEEHWLQVTGSLPTVEQYLQRRMGSSATRVCLAVHEYALGIELPPEAMESDDMGIIWHETNVIISIMNDVYSVKKEIDQGQVDNLVPLLSLRLGSPQAAVDEATAMVRASVRRFEGAAARAASGPGSADVGRFVDSCRSACTANMNWSLGTKRYKLDADATGGTVRVTL